MEAVSGNLLYYLYKKIPLCFLFPLSATVSWISCKSYFLHISLEHLLFGGQFGCLILVFQTSGYPSNLHLLIQMGRLPHPIHPWIIMAKLPWKQPFGHPDNVGNANLSSNPTDLKAVGAMFSWDRFCNRSQKLIPKFTGISLFDKVWHSSG